jgi:hypothetical protein
MNERACKRCGRETWSSRSPYCREHRPPPEVRAKWAAKTREARGYGAAHRTCGSRSLAWLRLAGRYASVVVSRSRRGARGSWGTPRTGRVGLGLSIPFATGVQVGGMVRR